MKNDNRLYYFLCNHWTEGGIGYAFPVGWYAGKKYEKGFSSVYTVEKMLDAADEYPTVKASMELDAYTYEVLSRIAPETVARLKEYIAAGRRPWKAVPTVSLWDRITDGNLTSVS